MIRKAMMLLIGLVLLVSTTTANGPSTVIKDVECGLLAYDGSYIMGTGHAVSVNNDNGITTLTCTNTQPAEIPRPTNDVYLDFPSTGMPCTTLLGDTQDWKETITPSGEIILVCKINPSSTP